MARLNLALARLKLKCNWFHPEHWSSFFLVAEHPELADRLMLTANK